MKKQIKKFLLSYIFIFILFHFGHSQDRITGQVYDVDNIGLPFCNVLLLNPADSSLVLGNIADASGHFILESIPEGQYLLEVSMLGFTTYLSETLSVTNTNEELELDPIVLSENSTQLDEIQIVEKRALFEQKIDRMVVNIANSITLSGSTALEVLKRSPGVEVNPQTNTIAMAGKSGVVVMINGKISRMPPDAIVQMLEGMSSDNIDKIELIHTPPANFDAEGNAGFINIVLKKNLKEGTNGGFTLNAGYGRHEKASASINLNHRKKNINFYGDYSMNYNHSSQIFTNYRGFDYEGTYFENSSESDRDPTKITVQNARLGADIDISDKTIFGVLLA